jgi:hypothetical protein
MTSTSGLIGNLGQANYAAAKLGVVGLSKSIAIDMQRFNVRSNSVAPFAWTQMVSSIPNETPEQQKRVEGLKKLVAEKSRWDRAPCCGQDRRRYDSFLDAAQRDACSTPREGSAAVRCHAFSVPSRRWFRSFTTSRRTSLQPMMTLIATCSCSGMIRMRATVVDLVKAVGLRALHGGAFVNSAAAEALTSVLIFLNKTYGVDGAGLRITGTLEAPAN